MQSPQKPGSAWTFGFGLLLTAALLSPLIALAVSGLTLTGMAEESSGYRYFYSLRLLYGDHERPWLPQGQLPGLAHLGIQVALTSAGYPPANLFPRMDLFSYAAAALPHLLVLPAFVWMARALPSPAAVAAAAGLVATAFLTGFSGYDLVLPDYPSWAEPVTLVAAGWLLRLGDTSRRGWDDDIRIGVFGGLCLAIKPTYAVFVIPIGLYVLATRRPFQRAAANAVSSAIIALATWLTVTWAYYLGDGPATIGHFTRLATYIDAVAAPVPFVEWLTGPSLWARPTAASVGTMLPIVLLISLAVLPRKALSAGLLVASVLSIYIGYRRFAAQTLVEVSGYAVVATLAWSVCILGAAREARRILPPRLVGSAMVIIAAILWLHVGRTARAAAASTVPVFRTADLGARSLAACLAAEPGRTLFLIPDNNYRTTTVDSAIFKGGSDVHNYAWGASPYVERLFPDRGYVVGATSKELPASEVDAYSKFVFVSLPGERDAAVERLRTMFAVSVDDFDCSCAVDFKYHVVNTCYR